MKEALNFLPSAARALLAQKLVESLEFDVDETLQTLWTYPSPKKLYLLRAGEQAQNLKLELFSG
ncbi:MAG: hypothetical protein V7K68_12185, partial [Nostoc sp.]|uniref:hypothetical protein n=1 Tax=Nostoc sp. TaxID=1180 RepID=UPI002FF9DDDD